MSATTESPRSHGGHGEVPEDARRQEGHVRDVMCSLQACEEHLGALGYSPEAARGVLLEAVRRHVGEAPEGPRFVYHWLRPVANAGTELTELTETKAAARMERLEALRDARAELAAGNLGEGVR